MTDSDANPLLDALDGKIALYHLLKHPFYRAWTEGRLSKQSLALYAVQYYRHVQAFPEHLRRLEARAEGELRRVVSENLDEELDPTNPHPALWRRFAAALGVDENSLDSARMLPGVENLVATYSALAEHGSLAGAVAAFYAYEAQVPEIAAQKRQGLQRFYGIEDPRAVAYFAVHEEADVRHRAAWRRWLGAQSERDSDAVVAAAERSLKALWGALDAVYPEGCAAN
jgi:pyrroloquinoline-quinone synthase